MSRQLLINNATAVPAAAAGTTTPADVAEARVAAFDADDFASGTLALDEAFEGENLVLVQGGEEDSIITSVINIKDVVSVHEKAYDAPTGQETTITPETGDGVATIRVVETSAGFIPHKRITIDVVLDDKTAGEIVDDFVAQFNANSPNFITASNSADKLVLTGDIGVSFETSLDQEAADWDIDSEAPNFGSGSAEHIANLEEVAYGGQYTNRIYLPVTPPSYAENENYDLFTILVRTNTTKNIASSNKYQEITIAVHNEASGIDLPVFFGFEEATE